MSETLDIARDQRNGRFVAGNSGNGGRPPGQRNKLGEAFLLDLRESWNRDGAQALSRCAQEDPAAYVRVVASLMPKDVNLNLNLDAGEFAITFERALAMLGNEVPRRKPMKVINGRR